MNYIDTTLPHIVAAKTTHKEKLKPIIASNRDVCGNAKIVNFLTDEVIEKLLVSEPKKLFQINLAFYRHMLGGDTLKDFMQYFKTKRKQNKTLHEQEIFDEFKSLKKELNTIFDYEAFSKKKKTYSAYDLANKLDVPTCPYCNRIYTKTVIKPSKITRPAFDHWYSKSDFPLLALSFYNLVPSCNICNSGVKGTGIFALDTHFHPYFKQDGELKINFKFSYDYKDYSSFRFKIICSNNLSKNSIAVFKMREIYEAHEDEIKDLRRLRDVYSDKYLFMLKNNILKGTSISDEEIYRLAFGTYVEETLFDRRPLSKMKKDILQELGIIKHLK